MSERETEVIYVPSSCLGLIIGRGGATIKSLSEESRCRINIKKDEADGDKTPISLEGSNRSIEDAKRRITEITERSRERRQDGGERSYGNDRGYNNDRRDDRRDDRNNDRYNRY